MAELLGVIAGGAGLASLAVQLTESAGKLKRIHHGYTHASETLEDVAEEIETFLGLSDMLNQERESFDSMDMRVLDQCRRICEKRVGKIMHIVQRLESLMAKSKRWAGLRTAVEKDEVDRLCLELGAKGGQLLLAYQLYAEYLHSSACDGYRLADILCRSRRRRETATYHFEILRHLTQMNAARRAHLAIGTMPWSSSHETAISTHHASKPHIPHKEFSAEIQLAQDNESSDCIDREHKPWQKQARPMYNRTSFRFSYQPWYASWIWDVSMRQTWTGWDLHWRTDRLVPDNDPVFYFTETGNLTVVRHLLESGQVTRNSYTHGGWRKFWGEYTTLLEAAICSANVDLCRYLLELTPPTEKECESLGLWLWLCRKDRQDKLEEDMYSAFLKHANLDPDNLFSPGYMAPWFYRGGGASIRALKAALPDMYAYSRLPLAIKFRVATDSFLELQKLPKKFMEALEVSTLDCTIARLKDHKGDTVLHHVADNLACEVLCFGSTGKNERQLVEFIGALRLAGADFHETNNRGYTPLLEYASYFTHQSPIPIAPWTSLPEEAGVSFPKYFKDEKDVCTSSIREARKKRYKVEMVDDLGMETGFQGVDVLVSEKRVVNIFKSTPVPGSWPNEVFPSGSKICWSPSGQDLVGNHWTWVGKVSLGYHVHTDPPELQVIYDMHTGTQDDAGRPFLPMSRGAKRNTSQRRSCSQPPEGRARRHDRLADKWDRSVVRQRQKAKLTGLERHLF